MISCKSCEAKKVQFLMFNVTSFFKIFNIATKHANDYLGWVKRF